jgi:hypothetical protein
MIELYTPKLICWSLKPSTSYNETLFKNKYFIKEISLKWNHKDVPSSSVTNFIIKKRKTHVQGECHMIMEAEIEVIFLHTKNCQILLAKQPRTV